jgi:filamentous hemagglutinin family protein
MLAQNSTRTAVGRVKGTALGSTALSLLFAGVAVAQVTPPSSGTLPGNFTTKTAGVTYTATNATTAAINNLAGSVVLQWGGAALSTAVPAAPGITANPNFSIGSGASLTLNGKANVLINDLTGSPSQIYGTLNASATSVLYVANASGVVVGSTGTITAPTKGVGLVGYLQDSQAYAGTLNVTGTTSGTGDVTVSGTVTGGSLLVAGNGTVNIGTTLTANAPFIVAGFPFTTGATVQPTVVGTPIGTSTASVNIQSGANVNLKVGAVTGTLFVAGVLTNNGQLTEPNILQPIATVSQLNGGLVNNGLINDSTGLATISINTKGNFQNKGQLNLTKAGVLSIAAANVDLEGGVSIANKALETKTPTALTGVTITTGATTKGVVDIGTTLVTDDTGAASQITGNVIRVLSGSITNTKKNGTFTFAAGTNASAVTDPFAAPGTTLNYAFSLFPNTNVSADTIVVGPAAGGGTSFSNSPGMNLNGTLTATNIGGKGTLNLTANNINGFGSPGKAGLVVPDGGTVNLTFFGNINNPSGAASNNSTAFNWNFLPISVAQAAGGKAGTVAINVKGPTTSGSSGGEQAVNLLVDGNVTLTSATTPVTLPAAILSSYANNHLVVQASGDITTPAAAFNWPGLVYLKSGTSTADPTAAPNSTSKITLGGNLSNVVPADFTTASIGGGTGGGGVFFITNNLSIAANTVTINNDSWANFVNATTASAFATLNGKQFSQAAVSGAVVNSVQLPTANFQPTQ